MKDYPINTNVATMYSDDLMGLYYNEEYDIRINAVQTALMILGYYDEENVEINSIIFGILEVNTMIAIKSFQRSMGLPKTGKLDALTYELIFKELKDKKNIIILKNGQNSIRLESFNSIMDAIVNELEYTFDDSELTVNVLDAINNIDKVGLDDLPLYVGGIIDGIFDVSDYVVNEGGISIINSFLEFILSGSDSNFFNDKFNLYGGESFEEIMYNYVSNGGKTHLGFEYDFDSDSGYTSEHTEYNTIQTGKKDYNYIYSLLSNSVYDGELDITPNASNTEGIKKFNGKYEDSSDEPFFDNNGFIGKIKYDIVIVYGASAKKSIKLLNVTPISVAQQLNASGEPISEVYEFVAKDIVYNK